MRTSISGAVVIALAVQLYPVGAPATLQHVQISCQSTVAKQARVFFRKTFGALADCRDLVLRGSLPPQTDCTLEPQTAEVVETAARALREGIPNKCPNSILAGLDFGGDCIGAATAKSLGDCLVETHRTAAESLVAFVYDQTGARTCAGGPNNGASCHDPAECPNGSCTLTSQQRSCVEATGSALLKLANKRQVILQSCKKRQAKGKIAPRTDCVDVSLAKLERAEVKAADAIRDACPDSLAPSLDFGGTCAGGSDADSLAACGICTDNRESDDLLLVQHGSSPRGGVAKALRITNTADCVGGPLSRCRAGDYLLANGRVRVVIQDLQRNLFNIGQFGGQIIDADLVRPAGQADRDSFEEWSLSINIENTAHYTSLTILNDGGNGGPAVLRATGVDDLLDFINPSSTIASFGFGFPAAADDTDLPMTVTTDYTLDPGANYVRVETTLRNLGGDVLNIFFGEYIGGSGQVELFQPGYGFGEPLVGTRCPDTASNPCNFTAFSGEDDADGVSYGYVHEVPGSSTFTTSGVHVPQLGVEVVLALIGAATPPFTIEPAGEAGDTLSFTRYFVVGNGPVSAITDARNEIQCLPTGRLEGTVRAGGKVAVRADVAVLGNPAEGPGLAPLAKNVVTHTRTDDKGRYSLTLPAGSYTVMANSDGFPYEGGGALPAEHAVAISAFETIRQDFSLPATGALRVLVTDETTNPIAAKVSVVGFDPSPDPLNTQSILGLINNTTGVFGDQSEDGVPFGVARALFIDQGGDSGSVSIEPSNYQVVVSHGMEYSIDATDIAVDAGKEAVVSAQVEHVIDTTGFVSGDFHVHSIDSPDAEVSHVERVVSMLAEGVDFFTPSDHDFLADFQPTIDQLGAAELLGTATGQEITTFDYGHFNSWPLAIDPDQVNGGAVDHGGAAPAGQDFPSFGFFSEPPATIVADAHANAAGADNTVQINHIHSHFGLDGGSGLAIDTGVRPPTSTVPASSRRLDPSIQNFFTDTYDALEIWIGDDRGQVFTNFLGQNIGDWFNLLNQGIVRTGIADSDTHRRIITQSGFPRSMVASATDDPGDLSAAANALSQSVNAGRVVGTNGPMVRVRATAPLTGEVASLELGYPTLVRTGNGAIDITVQIESPDWVEFDTVEYYVNTTTKRRTVPNQETGAGLLDVRRYGISPDYVQKAGADFTIETVAGAIADHREATTTLKLTGLTEDSWVVVLVRGTDGVSRPLFPVVPNSLRRSTNTTLAGLTDGNLGEDGITAMAFTNPLFIDVDGGAWSAPGVRVE